MNREPRTFDLCAKYMGRELSRTRCLIYQAMWEATCGTRPYYYYYYYYYYCYCYYYYYYYYYYYCYCYWHLSPLIYLFM